MDKNSMKRVMAKVIARTWKDPEFKKRLLANPKAVLAEMGYKVPANVHVKVYEETKDTHNLVLPPAPAHVEELSDAQLEKLSGGTDQWTQGTCATCQDCCMSAWPSGQVL